MNAQRALDAAQQADTAAADTRRRTEQAMLTSYQSEDELRRVFTERAAMLDNNVRTARYNVASLRAGLTGQLGSAGDQNWPDARCPTSCATASRDTQTCCASCICSRYSSSSVPRWTAKSRMPCTAIARWSPRRRHLICGNAAASGG
jgi:hypothetical protein